MSIANKKKRAIVLASGGLDSTTVLALAAHKGYEIYALSFNYGQRHKLELKAAENVVKKLGAVKHTIVRIDLRAIGGSALTDAIPVPKKRSLSEIGNGIPVTYVPARNTIFLSFALAWAEVMKIENIFIGVNALDYSGYPDCRPEYIDAFQGMANLAIKEAVEGKMRIRIHTPLMKMNKADIIRTGLDLGVDYGMTWSCYDPKPGGIPCGQCDSCLLRKKGFSKVGIPDPLNKGL